MNSCGWMDTLYPAGCEEETSEEMKEVMEQGVVTNERILQMRYASHMIYPPPPPPPHLPFYTMHTYPPPSPPLPLPPPLPPPQQQQIEYYSSHPPPPPLHNYTHNIIPFNISHILLPLRIQINPYSILLLFLLLILLLLLLFLLPFPLLSLLSRKIHLHNLPLLLITHHQAGCPDSST